MPNGSYLAMAIVAVAASITFFATFDQPSGGRDARLEGSPQERSEAPNAHRAAPLTPSSKHGRLRTSYDESEESAPQRNDQPQSAGLAQKGEDVLTVSTDRDAFLDLDRIRRLGSDAVFSETMQSLLEDRSEAAMQKTMTYRSLLEAQPEIYSGQAMIEAMACSARACMASITFFAEDAAASYLERVGKSTEPKVGSSLTVPREEDSVRASGVNYRFVFSIDDQANGFSSSAPKGAGVE